LSPSPVDSFDLSFSCTLLYAYLDLLDLHSFPTRRSSDLRIDWCFRTDSCGVPRRRRTRSKALPPRVAGSRRSGTRSVTPRARRRSEEHTSELQSRENLVCRLLLEKKKKCMVENAMSTFTA